MSGHGHGGAPTNGTTHASTRVYGGDHPKFVVALDLRGFSKRDVKALHHGNSIIVRIGGTPSGIERHFPAPQRAVLEEITAQFNNGVLTITAPIRG